MSYYISFEKEKKLNVIIWKPILRFYGKISKNKVQKSDEVVDKYDRFECFLVKKNIVNLRTR